MADVRTQNNSEQSCEMNVTPFPVEDHFFAGWYICTSYCLGTNDGSGYATS